MTTCSTSILVGWVWAHSWHFYDHLIRTLTQSCWSTLKLRLQHCMYRSSDAGNITKATNNTKKGCRRWTATASEETEENSHHHLTIRISFRRGIPHLSPGAAYYRCRYQRHYLPPPNWSPPPQLYVMRHPPSLGDVGQQSPRPSPPISYPYHRWQKLPRNHHACYHHHHHTPYHPVLWLRNLRLLRTLLFCWNTESCQLLWVGTGLSSYRSVIRTNTTCGWRQDQHADRRLSLYQTERVRQQLCESRCIPPYHHSLSSSPDGGLRRNVLPLVIV